MTEGPHHSSEPSPIERRVAALESVLVERGLITSDVVDAVVVHELAHLVEANHSPAFHALADRFPRQERATGFLIAKGLADPDLEEPD